MIMPVPRQREQVSLPFTLPVPIQRGQIALVESDFVPSPLHFWHGSSRLIWSIASPPKIDSRKDTVICCRILAPFFL